MCNFFLASLFGQLNVLVFVHDSLLMVFPDLLLLTFPVFVFSFFHLVLVVQFPLLEDTILVLGVGLHARIMVLDVVHLGLDVNLFLFVSCDVSFISERVLNICVEQELVAIAFDGAHGCVGLGKRRHRSMEVH